jgi:hypothetical protein
MTSTATAGQAGAQPLIFRRGILLARSTRRTTAKRSTWLRTRVKRAAIASGGVRVLNDDVVSWYRVPEAVIDKVAHDEQAEL